MIASIYCESSRGVEPTPYDLTCLKFENLNLAHPNLAQYLNPPLHSLNRTQLTVFLATSSWCLTVYIVLWDVLVLCLWVNNPKVWTWENLILSFPKLHIWYNRGRLYKQFNISCHHVVFHIQVHKNISVFDFHIANSTSTAAAFRCWTREFIDCSSAATASLLRDSHPHPHPQTD